MSQGIAGRGAFVRSPTSDQLHALPIRAAVPRASAPFVAFVDSLLKLPGFEQIPERFGAGLRSLSRESHPEIFLQALLNAARRLEEEDLREAALGIYRAIAEHFPGEGSTGGLAALLDRAKEKLEASAGRGHWGPRLLGGLEKLFEELLDPAPLVAMGGAGLAYKAGKLWGVSRMLLLPATPMTRGLAARTASSLIGFGAEVPAFVLGMRGMETLLGRSVPSRPLPEQLAGAALFLGPVKLLGWMGHALPSRVFREEISRGMLSPFARATQSALGTAGSFAGILLGQEAERQFHGLPAVNLEQALLGGLATYVHLRIAGRMTQRLISGPFGNLEGRIDQALAEAGRGLEFASAATAGAGLEFPIPIEVPQRANMAGWGTPSGDFIKASLYRKFRDRFPPQGPEVYSEHVLETTLSIPCELPDFHFRLLEAMVRSPERGSYLQALTSEAIKRVFSLDALATSTGSFDDALVQSLFQQITLEANPLRRRAAFDAVLSDLDAGLTRARILERLLEYGESESLRLPQNPGFGPDFVKPHEAYLDGAWRGLSLPHQVAVLDFIHRVTGGDGVQARDMMKVFAEAWQSFRYDPISVHRALEFARQSPLGFLALRRIYNVFAAQDHPAKLTEIYARDDSPNTSILLRQLQAEGLSADAMAAAITGTRHTAYLEDLRVARKVLSLHLDFEDFPPDSRELGERRRRLDGGIVRFIRSGFWPGVEQLVELLEANESPEMRSLRRAWETGALRIEMLEDADFDGLLARWGASDARHAVFQAPNRILLRQWPEKIPHGASGEEFAFAELLGRLKGVVHEWEHWRHSSGNYEGLEHGGRPFELRNITRHDRLASEILAHLEHYRWEYKNFSDDLGLIAERLGQTPALFFRNLTDEAYFGPKPGGAEKRAP